MEQNNYLFIDETTRIMLLDRVRIIKHKNPVLIGKEGVIKQFAKTGKIRVTIEGWNQWCEPGDLKRIGNAIKQSDIMHIEISNSPFVKKREPKFKIGEELRYKKTGTSVGSPCAILVEYDIDNNIKEIYYKFRFEDESIKEEDLSDDWTTWNKYVKKHIVVDAYQTRFKKIVHTHNGNVMAEPGDYIIKDIEGKEYPCKKEIFEKTYDEYKMVTTSDNNIVDDKFNYKFSIDNEVTLKDTLNKIDGKIVGKTFKGNELAYNVLIDNIVRVVPQSLLTLKDTLKVLNPEFVNQEEMDKKIDDAIEVAIKEISKEEKLPKEFKFNFGQEVMHKEIGKSKVVDRKIHHTPDGENINQYKIIQHVTKGDNIEYVYATQWINEDELSVLVDYYILTARKPLQPL